MKCPVCGFEITEGEAECGRCGFPILVQLGDSEDAVWQLKQMADRYRAQACGEYEIGVAAHTNTVRNDRVEVLQTEYIILAKGDMLKEGVIIWYPEGFVRPASNKLEFRFYISRGSGPKIMHVVNLELIPASGDIHIGVMGGEGGTFSICIGSASGYAKTGWISMFSMQFVEDERQAV